jgi:outer membrane lipoprotein carrier protein
LHGSAVPGVKSLVRLQGIIGFWLALPTAVGAPPLLQSVEARYNHVQSLRLDFSETYVTSGRPSQTETGTLYLRKPGRMRWEYSTPAGKLFLSDGKDVYLYLPEERRAEKSKLKESDDFRVPLAFLLGKLDFDKEFESFEMRPEGDATDVIAKPKSKDLYYTRVDFVAYRDGRIARLRVTGQDQSKIEFVFSNEQLNTPVNAGMFVLKLPAGVPIVEAER